MFACIPIDCVLLRNDNVALVTSTDLIYTENMYCKLTFHVVSCRVFFSTDEDVLDESLSAVNVPSGASTTFGVMDELYLFHTLFSNCSL